jgi:glycosyltransferase involved in cell wall biosynthesis
MKLSVVLATRNEEANIARCLNSVKDIADEMVVVDEYSTDKTREIAERLGAKVYKEPHHDIFHVTKQRALELAKGEWILQLDADEVVTPQLRDEIVKTINMSDPEIKSRINTNMLNGIHFKKHQRLIEERDGRIGRPSGEITAFFIPRLNMFLGKPLRYGGVYPDGVIRLVKNGKARFPQKSVHEQIEVDGEVAWLFNDLEHYDSPTMNRYLKRFNRYTDLIAREYGEQHLSRGLFAFINHVILKPSITFLSLYIRHKGILDGASGFLWSFFSASRFPVAYFKYYMTKR